MCFPTKKYLKISTRIFLRVDGVKQPVAYYTLDVIISVGYRVKSQSGVQFRQWANRVLKEYLVKGYAINQRIHREQIGELRQLVSMIGRTIQNQTLLSNDETNACIEKRGQYIIDKAMEIWEVSIK